jgi:hypothetical protein
MVATFRLQCSTATQSQSVSRKLISGSHALNLSTFTAHHHNHLNGNRANRGTDILVKNYFSSFPFNFQPPQQDITVHLNLPSLSFTLWSVYFLLGVCPTDLTTLISLLSPSFILPHDCNTIYIFWGSVLNDRSRTLCY